AASQELVAALLEMHGVGLVRILDLLAQAGDPGRKLLDAFTQDGLLASLLLLHGLHPDDFQTRIERALDRVRPLLRAHQGDVELLDTSGGVVRLRWHAGCHTCPSTAASLEQAIQDALYESVPDLVALEIERMEQSAPDARLIALPLIDT